MQVELIVDLIGKLGHQPGRKPVINTNGVLLPTHGYIDGRGESCRIEPLRRDAAEIDISVAVNYFNVLENWVDQVPRSKRHLRRYTLPADVLGSKRMSILVRHAIFETQVPVALVIIEVRR